MSRDLTRADVRTVVDGTAATAALSGGACWGVAWALSHHPFGSVVLTALLAAGVVRLVVGVTLSLLVERD